MNQVLDEIEDKKNSSKIFSKLSFGTSMALLILVGYLFIHPMPQIKVGNTILQPLKILVALGYILLFFGLVTTFLSFFKREPPNWMKWVGGILNCLLLLLIIMAIILAQVVDFD